MRHSDYLEMEENAATGRAIAENVAAVMEGRTMAKVQRDAFKYTDAGICISFGLFDGSFVWTGDARAFDAALVPHIRRIGVSSIVEGSDAGVPLTWLDAAAEKYMVEGGAELFAADYAALCEHVDGEVCALWEEANSDDGVQS